MDTKSIRKKPSKKKKSRKITQKRRQWDDESMQNAIRAVKNDNLGFKAAAITYNVPRTSLFRLCSLNDNVAQDLIKPKLGRKPIFPPELEEQLVDHVLEMARAYPNFTNIDIKRLAFQYAEANNIPNAFAKCREVAGKRWLKNFKERHKDKLVMQNITDHEILTKNKTPIIKKIHRYVRQKQNENTNKVKTERMLKKESNTGTILRPHEIDIKKTFEQEFVFSPELKKNMDEDMEQSSCSYTKNEMKHFTFEPTEAHRIDHTFNRHIIKNNWFELFCNRHKDKLLLLNNIKTEEELAQNREAIKLENEIFIRNLDEELMPRNIDTDIINDETDDEIMEDVNMEIEEEIMKLKQNVEEESKWVEASIEDITIMHTNIFTKEKAGNKRMQTRNKEVLPLIKKSPPKKQKAPNKEISKRHTWDEESMELAISAIKEKRMGFKIAADTFRVPRSTLFRLAAKVEYDTNSSVKTKLSRKPVFTSELESNNTKKLTKRIANKRSCISCKM